MSAPQLSVVVASRDRPLRLRWLLNALEQQSLHRSLWEVVVCHDSLGAETDQLLASHPLTGAGTLRSLRSVRTTAGAKRNRAVAGASAPTLVFTDDDCRPPPGWLENVQAVASTHPGAIVQGPVHGDPDESAMRRSPYPRTQTFEHPPTAWAECCNIVYPRELVQRIGGFAEDLSSGEDTDLNLRARAAGASYLGDSRLLTFHAIEDGTVLGWVRASRRWGDLALLVKRHPELRRELCLRIFWKRSHGWLTLALAGALLTARDRRWAALAIPWVLEPRARRGGLRGRLRELTELPGWAVIELGELLVLLRGSARHRSVLL